MLWTALHGQRWMDVTAAAMSRALEVHRMLAERSQHRHFRLPDLIIAATADSMRPRSCTMTRTTTASPR